MAKRHHSNPCAIQDVIDCGTGEHKQDHEGDKREEAAPSQAGPARDPASDDAEVVLELQRYRAQLRDHEKTLVDRIADVDDERRAMESRLQRTWKMQRKELDSRLTRHTGWLAGLLVFFALALFLVYRQASIGQLEVAASVSTLREELAAQLPSDDAVDTLAREKLEWLGAEVREIASSLGRLVEDGKPAPQASLVPLPADLGPSETALGRQLRNLGATQRHLSEALKNLRLVVQNFETGLGGSPAKSEAASAAESDMFKAGAPVPAEYRTPAATLADAGAVNAVASGDATPLAGQEPNNRILTGSQATLIAAQGNYALQLIGVSDRKSLKRFLGRDGLPERVYSIHGTYKDRPWHVVLHSLHEGYTAAAEARSRLPPELAALDPWIRPLSAGVELHIIETGSKH